MSCHFTTHVYLYIIYVTIRWQAYTEAGLIDEPRMPAINLEDRFPDVESNITLENLNQLDFASRFP